MEVAIAEHGNERVEVAAPRTSLRDDAVDACVLDVVGYLRIRGREQRQVAEVVQLIGDRTAEIGDPGFLRGVGGSEGHLDVAPGEMNALGG
ncbi:unannotated protein [freshwater metagenome]|uniref:Unannotated protein n=1 Tax=freshwater metagenome TaxID=449393 RepID=A0A6J7M160_9ZZZZ